jgi:hypothetical protein
MRIRENQRRSRNRRKELIEDLQKRVQEYELKGVAATQEVQRAAQRVAQENVKLRCLLAVKGILQGEIDEFLQSFREVHASEAIPTDATVVSTSRAAIQPRIRTLESLAVAEDTVQQPVMSPTAAFAVPQPAGSELHRGPDIPIVTPPSHTIMHGNVAHHHHQLKDNTHIIPVLDEPECPNDADCFCAPSTVIGQRRPSPGLEISCEAAASIIVEMRGDGDIEAARASLGCCGTEECNVKNSTVLQIMDER